MVSASIIESAATVISGIHSAQDTDMLARVCYRRPSINSLHFCVRIDFWFS